MSLQQWQTSQANPEVVVNQNFNLLAALAVYGRDPTTTTGLTWGFIGGRWGGFAVTAGTLTLAASQTNRIVVNRSTGVISTSTNDTNWDNLADFARVYRVVTGTTTVTSFEDHRMGPGGVLSSGGGGGGLQSVVAGSGIAVDNTDPANPVVSATSGGGGGGITLSSPVNPSGPNLSLSVPAGVNRVTLMCSSLNSSPNNSNDIIVRLGVSGTPVNTGYRQVCSHISTTINAVISLDDAFYIEKATLSSDVDGHMIFSRSNGNIWYCHSNFVMAGSGRNILGNGSVVLSGDLSSIHISVVGGANLAAYSVLALSYET